MITSIPVGYKLFAFNAINADYTLLDRTLRSITRFDGTQRISSWHSFCSIAHLSSTTLDRFSLLGDSADDPMAQSLLARPLLTLFQPGVVLHTGKQTIEDSYLQPEI